MVFNPEQNGTPVSAPAMENPMANGEKNEAREDVAESVESGESQESHMEKLQQALDEARAGYARVRHKRGSMVEKIMQKFGKNVDTGSEQDVDVMKTAYQQSLENFRRAKMADIDQLSEEQQKDALAELKSFDLNESCSLYDSHVAAKLDTLGGKAGEVLQKTVDWYKKVPTKYKIALSATLFVGGVATAGGAAAGVFGAAALGKRVLGSAAAGVGATGWMEARAQKKEQASRDESLENFKNLSIEEQRAQLAQFDDASFQKIEESFQGKVTGRQRRVVLGMTTAAGMMALGSFGKIFGASEAAAAEIPTAQTSAADHIAPQEVQAPKGNSVLIQKAIEQMRAQQEMAQTAASGMGIDQGNISATFEGGAPVEINGQPVAEGLVTEQSTTPDTGMGNMSQATEQPLKNDLVARLNSMKNMTGSSVNEVPADIAQQEMSQMEPLDTTSPEQPNVPKKGLMDAFNNMRARTVFEESQPQSTESGSVGESQPKVAAVQEESPRATAAEHAAKAEQPSPKAVRFEHQSGQTLQTAMAENGVSPRVMSYAQEQQYIKELVQSDPTFNQAVAERIKNLYGLPPKNVANIPMAVLAENNPTAQARVDRVLRMAGKYLGEDTVKSIVNNKTATVGTIFTRISALGQKAGVSEKIFSA